MSESEPCKHVLLKLTTAGNTVNALARKLRYRRRPMSSSERGRSVRELLFSAMLLTLLARADMHIAAKLTALQYRVPQAQFCQSGIVPRRRLR